MEISIKSTVLFGAIILTGLSAGLFYAWSVSVIPGTQKVSDEVYLKAMQSINREILNPAFFLIFFGSAVLLIISSIYQFHVNQLSFWLMVGATASYVAGTVSVTGMGNVPLNDQLEALNLAELTSTKLNEFRTYYETNWNRLHSTRTAFAVISFAMAVLSVLSQLKKF